MTRVFIDGSVGTTGLRIKERLENRKDIELISLPYELRKDIHERKIAINSSDITFLCLPDTAAIEAVSLVENSDTAVIDASTAHRTNPHWAYGFPELSTSFFDRIINSKRIANPGCHASGFIALVYPLIKEGILPCNARLTCHSITGYSGGGKSMIAEYENEFRDKLFDAPRQYGLSQTHKHLPEMQKITNLKTPPIFCPIVSVFYSGMEVTVPLFADDLSEGKSAEDIKEVYKALYKGDVVRYSEEAAEGSFLSAGAFSGKDSMEISVHGNNERILLTARYDNLGKGASGAAVECMNIIIGADSTEGLEI